MVWVQIFLRRGEPEEALKTVQKRLHTQVWQVQASLSTLLFPGVIPDEGQAMEVCRTYREMEGLFGLGQVCDGLFFELYLRWGRVEEAAESLARYVDAMLDTVETPNSRLFSPGVKTAEKPASSREMRILLLKQLGEDAQYRPLLGCEKGRAALEKLKASVGTG